MTNTTKKPAKINFKNLTAKEIKDSLEENLKKDFSSIKSINLLIDNVINYSVKTDIFSKYSFLNAMLILKQINNPTELRTFNGWSKNGTKIKKGSKAIYILKPLPFCKEHKNPTECPEDCTKKIMHFKKIVLFDAKQTDLKAEEIEALAKKNFKDRNLNPEFNQLVDILKSQKDFVLEFDENTNQEGGYTDGQKIVISVDSNPELKYNILLHEFGHLILNHPYDGLGYKGHIRGVKEIQAEMFAWVSEKILDLSTPTTQDLMIDYIKSWSMQTKDYDPLKEFGKIFKLVNSIFNPQIKAL